MVVAVEAFKIAYMAVPKSACTSVKAALAMVDPAVSVDPKELAENSEMIHQVYQTMRFRPHRWRQYEGWYRFTVVRDPLKRLLAVYTDRVVGRRELHNSPRLRAQTELPMDPDPDFFFQNLERYIEKASSVKHHAFPVRLFIGRPPLEYDRVFKIEELGELADELSNRCGQPVEIPRFNSSKSKLVITDLHPKTQDAVAQYVENEYKHLGAFYQNPFAV